MSSYRKGLVNVQGSVIPRNTLSDTGPSGYGRPAGALEFCTVEDSSRPRRRPRVRSNSHRHMDGIQAKRDPITDCSNDELASDYEPEPHRNRQTRPNGTVINSRRITDGADFQFFPKSSQPVKGKKRKNSASDIEDDELAESRYTKSQLSKPARRLGNSTPRVESHSVSRRGAIAPTKFTSSPSKALQIRVKDAICQPIHLLSDFHSSTSPNGECFLKPCKTPGRIELCAFRDDDAKAADVFDWLKVGSKITRLGFNEGSEIIRITQSQEAKIGPLMLLQFSSATDANTVVSWVRSNLASAHISYEVEESARLAQIFNKQKVAIKRENRAQRDKARDSNSHVLEHPSEPQRPNSDVPRATRTSPREANGDRVLLRDRMQVSNSNTEEQAAHRPAHQTPSQPSSVRSRPRAQSDDESWLERVKSLNPSSLAKHDPPRRGLRPRQTAPDMYAIEDDPEPEPFPPRWSEEHPNWSKSWRMPLTLRRTTVDAQDIPRLDEGEYLNDNLIDFGLQYLFDKAGNRKPDLLNRIYFFNTFFYTQLRKSGKGKNINYDGVKSWTSRVDLFSYDYVIVPVNENLHWWLAIICNARKLDPSSCDAMIDLGQSDKKAENEEQDKSVNSHPDGTAADISQLSIDSPSNSRPDGEDGNPDKMLVDLVGEDIVMKDGSPPRRSPETTKAKENDHYPSPFPKGCSPSDFKILTLDSLGLGHSPAVGALKTYLIQELRDKKKKEANELSGNVGMKAIHIPGQDNHCDCGVFLLGYVKEFLQDPDKFVHTLLRKDKPDWTLDASEQREDWRDTILVEQKMQQDKAEQAKQNEGERKREAKRSTLTPPTPPVKKKTKPEPCVEKSRSSPLVKEVDDGLKKGGLPMDLTTPVKDTKLPSRPHTASPTPTEKKTAPVSIDLSSPVAKEKKADLSIDLSSPIAEEKTADLRPTSGYKTASRPKTAIPPQKQARELSLSTPPPKGIKDSPRSTQATIGRSTLAPPPVTTTAMPKDGDKDQDKDDSFQEVSPTNFDKTDRSRHRSHPPSSPARPKSGVLGISNPNRPRSQHEHRPQTVPPSSTARSSGMADYATLQSPPPPHNHLRSLRSPRQHQQQAIPSTSLYTGSMFMLVSLPDDDSHSHSPPHSDAARARSSVTPTHTPATKGAGGSGGGGMIDLTAEDSMVIEESIEGREEPGAI